MVAAVSKTSCALRYVTMACFLLETVSLVAMVGLASVLSGSYHGVSAANAAYRVSFMIRLMLPCFPPSRVVGRV